MNRYVIIGGGVASVGCIEGIRSVDKTGKITFISGEEKPVYCRPLISYYLQDVTDFEKMKYRPDSFYADNGCELYYAKAEKINLADKTVNAGGKALEYDKLCVATGSSPFVPPFKGLDTVEKKFYFMTESDAETLKKSVNGDTKVLIIGAGLIGLKCAEGIKDRVCSVTVCDLATRVLSSILDDECAAMMQKHLENNGITFMLGDSVSQFTGGIAIMNSGKTVPFDVVVLAVGVRPNVGLLKEEGALIDRGIITKTDMQTSVADIYAAGDCVQGYDASICKNRILAILPNAYMQGYTAGVNMAGGNAVFDKGMPMNAIGFFGLHALTAGSYDGELYEEKGENFIRRLFVKDGYLIGFILIGKFERAGIYTSLIREKTPLSTVDFDLLKLSPALSAFDKENRSKKLGGVV